MKEKLEEAKLKLIEASKIISELAEAGVNIELTISTIKTQKSFICDNSTIVSITSATMQTEL